MLDKSLYRYNKANDIAEAAIEALKTIEGKLAVARSEKTRLTAKAAATIANRAKKLSEKIAATQEEEEARIKEELDVIKKQIGNDSLGADRPAMTKLITSLKKFEKESNDYWSEDKITALSTDIFNLSNLILNSL
jgi:hypothetical protein